MSDPYWTAKEAARQFANDPEGAQRYCQAISWTPTWKGEIRIVIFFLVMITFLFGPMVAVGTVLRYVYDPVPDWSVLVLFAAFGVGGWLFRLLNDGKLIGYEKVEGVLQKLKLLD